jgi:hypothetical protein
VKLSWLDDQSWLFFFAGGIRGQLARPQNQKKTVNDFFHDDDQRSTHFTKIGRQTWRKTVNGTVLDVLRNHSIGKLFDCRLQIA